MITNDEQKKKRTTDGADQLSSIENSFIFEFHFEWIVINQNCYNWKNN